MTEANFPPPAKQDQPSRLRAILNGDTDDANLPPPPEGARLISGRQPQDAKPVSPPTKPRSHSVAPTDTPRSQPKARGRFTIKREQIGPAFWKVTNLMSFTVDIVLIAVVVLLLLYVRKLNLKIEQLQGLTSMPLDTVQGLYSNFEKMNSAHIITTIPYSTEIPVRFDLQIDTQTEVVLSRNTPINGAIVTLNTGGLEISGAPANIILPAGTRLPINLLLTVPVDKKLPVTLEVPVDIDLSKTDLGASFTGLMDVLEPLYCLLDSQSVDAAGISICEKAKTP